MNIDRKWVGKNQKKILGALIQKNSCTKLEISDLTGINNSVVTNALYCMIDKGLVLRDGNRYSVIQ